MQGNYARVLEEFREKIRMRYLIINADDFGVCTATNKAIEKIFDEGIISSTTIMTPCPGAEDAVSRALRNPNMNLGLHITTNAEWTQQWGQWKPVAKPEQVSSLTDVKGYFYSTVQEFSRQAKAEEVMIEMEAQYHFLTSRGIQPTHADSHMGSVYGLSGPSFMEETLLFCGKYKLPFRFPKNIENVKQIIGVEEVPPPLAVMHEQVMANAKLLGVKLIDNLFTSTVDFSELTGYEKMKEIYFCLVSQLPEGVSELFLHPSLPDSPVGENNPKWLARVWEYQLLLDDDFKKHIEREGVSVITYPEIP